MGRRPRLEERRLKEGITPPGEEWRSFITTWDKAFPAQNAVLTWAAFFSAFKAAAPTEGPKRQPEIVPAHFAQFFMRFDDIYGEFYRSGAVVSAWEVAQLGADEVRVCSVLAWLLDRHGSHGQGDAFLRCFLDCMNRDKRPETPSVANIGNGYRTRAESSYDVFSCDQPEKSSSRVDIEVNGPDILLFIEAKIYAEETNNQLKRYLDILRATAGARGKALVFVTPTGRLPQCDSVRMQPELFTLSWKRIAQEFVKYTKSMMHADGFATVLIRQFCDHITRF